jgi:hypothetical protein
MAEPLPNEDQSPEDGFQSSETGEGVMALLAKAGSAIQAADFAPIETYTETGATLTFVAEASGDIEIAGDGKIYALTITGDCSLVTGDWPTAPECANVTVAILVDTATPPVIAIDATWNWAGSSVTAIPTEDGARCILQLASYPQGWIEASVREIGVPS